MPIKPTAKQLENSEGMGWIFIEKDNVFMRGDVIGWFTKKGFKNCLAEDFER